MLKKDSAYMLTRSGELISTEPYLIRHPILGYVECLDWDNALDASYGDWLWCFKHVENPAIRKGIQALFWSFIYGDKMSERDWSHFDDKQTVIDDFELEGAEFTEYDMDLGYEFVNAVQNALNQDFCQVRTSSPWGFQNTLDGCIYIRITSDGFNWFDLIWRLLLDNKNAYETVTVDKCEKGEFDPKSMAVYEIKGKRIDHMPIDEFLTLSDNPVLESDSQPFFAINKKLNEALLVEKTRQELINKSRKGDAYKDTSKGKNRWERRRKSKIDAGTAQYNKLNMNDFFKKDVLELNLTVHGETDDYNVKVKMNGVLKFIQDEIKHNNGKMEFKCVLRAINRAFNEDAVYFFCDCPDFKYRQQYWATKGDYNAGPAQNDNGKGIANPNDTKGGGCKHVNLVQSGIDWIMKTASVVNNYCKYLERSNQRLYADIVYPKLFGIPYDKGVQLSLLDDEDDLENAKDGAKLTSRYKTA